MQIKNITQTRFGGGGRLGNQLFGIASVIGSAIKLGARPIFPHWGYEKYFKYSLPSGEIKPTHYYHEPYFHYTPIVEDDIVGIQAGAIEVLDMLGYFQSEHYWSHCKKEVINQFQFEDHFAQNLLLKYSELFIHSNVRTCSIHVRRGDYVNNDYYAETGMDYYNKAIQIIKNNVPNVKFLIFSDDIEYCKGLFIGQDYVFMEGNSDIEDLFLGTQCHHNIGCNSSFSFWMAYLNKNKNALKCFPKQWFGQRANLDTRDLYLQEWIVL